MPTPLAGQRIVITRAASQADLLATRLRALGAVPLLHPAIAIVPPDDLAPLDTAIHQIAQYDWLIVTSANSVRALFERMRVLGVNPNLANVTIGAVGPATAAALREHGLAPQLVPDDTVAEGLLAALGDMHGKRVLLPTADIARETLASGLRERGAHVDAVIAYRTVPGAGAVSLAPLLAAGTVDAITFTSSSTVRYLLEGLVQTGMNQPDLVRRLNDLRIVCIGPITAQTARESGLHVAAEAASATNEGIIAALLTAFTL